MDHNPLALDFWLDIKDIYSSLFLTILRRKSEPIVDYDLTTGKAAHLFPFDFSVL